MVNHALMLNLKWVFFIKQQLFYSSCFDIILSVFARRPLQFLTHVAFLPWPCAKRGF